MKLKWQRGYSAFTLHRSRIPSLIRYIGNQEEHHKKRSPRDELRATLREYGVDFKEEDL